MKLLVQSLIYSFLLGTAAARTAHVYLSDSLTNDPAPANVSPSTARLIIAQRLGLSEFHSLHDIDDASLQALRAYGGGQRRLFSNGASSKESKKALVVLENVRDSTAPDVSSASHFDIHNAPRAAENDDLLEDFSLQAKNSEGLCSPGLDSWIQDHLIPALSPSQWKVSQFDCVATIRGVIPDEAQHTQAFLKAQLNRMFDVASRENIDLVALLTTRDTSAGSSSFFKRSSQEQSWGSSILKSRQSDGLAGLLEDIKEAVGGSEDDVDPAAPHRPAIDELNPEATTGRSRTSTTSTYSRPTASAPPAPPKGILPACFPSMQACEDTTHDCSGHGACTLRYSLSEKSALEKRQGGSKSREVCYACVCSDDVRKTAGGLTKTTRWAGPACQKKDVSTEFWLIAGFTILLVAIISWAVGLLWSMGSEELPSVIGAGVAGPRAK